MEKDSNFINQPRQAERQWQEGLTGDQEYRRKYYQLYQALADEKINTLIDWPPAEVAVLSDLARQVADRGETELVVDKDRPGAKHREQLLTELLKTAQTKSN